jgi:RimJ/RimL family protein N-acetyltransferase
MSSDLTGVLESQRLSLFPMTTNFLRAALAHDTEGAYRQLALTLPPGWPDRITPILAMRLEQLERDRTLQPWLMRAIAVRGSETMIGHIGFHTAPDPAYLKEFAPGGVELGFTIFAPYRRQGYAEEASSALMAWARSMHDVTRFVLSISPDNAPSRALAAKLGFTKIGSHIDEADGVEDVFVREFSRETSSVWVR